MPANERQRVGHASGAGTAGAKPPGLILMPSRSQQTGLFLILTVLAIYAFARAF